MQNFGVARELLKKARDCEAAHELLVHIGRRWGDNKMPLPDFERQRILNVLQKGIGSP